LQQAQDGEEAAPGGNHRATTIYHLNDDLLRLSHAFLGVGHFRYGPLACKMFLRASKVKKRFKKFTTGEFVTSSISCARKYFEDKGPGEENLEFFRYSAARYGRWK
jgi:hypothetical protein